MDIGHFLELLLVDLVSVGNIVELNKILRKHKCVVKDVPQPLLLVILFCSEHTRHVIVHFGVHWCVSPDF